MRFNFTIHADSPEELRASLEAMQAALPPKLFNTPNVGFSIDVSPDRHAPFGRDFGPAERPVASSAPAPVSDVAEPAAPVPETAPAKRHRRTKAEIAAAEAASKEGQGEYEVTAAGEEQTKLPFDDEPQDEDAAPVPDEPEPSPQDTIAPAEAKLKALDVLRDAYLRDGGAAKVKALQASFVGAGKFMDLPDAKGPELLAAAVALLASLPTPQAEDAA